MHWICSVPIILHIAADFRHRWILSFRMLSRTLYELLLALLDGSASMLVRFPIFNSHSFLENLSMFRKSVMAAGLLVAMAAGTASVQAGHNCYGRPAYGYNRGYAPVVAYRPVYRAPVQVYRAPIYGYGPHISVGVGIGGPGFGPGFGGYGYRRF
jgi:hypothetical protein